MLKFFLTKIIHYFLFKDNFLIYAEFIVRCKNLEKSIQMLIFDQNIQDEVYKMTKELMNKRDNRNDLALPTNLNLMLSMPFKHLVQ